jgi:hypothetical protein
MANSYIDKIAVEIRRSAEPNAASADEDLSLYRIYAVLLLAKGRDVTAEDVHNAWAAWASEHEPESWSLLPFKEIPIRVQCKDKYYVDVIHKVIECMRE